MRTAKAAKKVAEKVRGSYVGKALGRVLGRAAEVAEKGKGSYVGKKVLGIIPGGAARTSEKQHPLLSGTGGPSRPGGPKKGVVLITSDRGLCGAFNTVLLRTMEDFLAEHADSEPVLYLMGNRGIEYFNRRGFKAFSSRAVGTKRPEYSTAAEIARELIDLYLNKEVDEVYIVYSEFISALTQVPRIRRLLPITPEAAEEAVDEVAKEEAPVPPGPGEEGGQPDGEGRNGEAEVKFLYEPSTREVLADLLPKHVEVQFFSTLLESSASEHGARMTAMDAASRSASEMIDGLTLKYNRLRQAAITKELMEIISGAESLKS
jgi:F-type H+-transporting ATPase subunit gamma